jgi:hypothetical protein
MDSLVIMFGLLFIIGFALIVSRAKNTSATRDTPQTRNAETHNSDPDDEIEFAEAGAALLASRQDAHPHTFTEQQGSADGESPSSAPSRDRFAKYPAIGILAGVLYCVAVILFCLGLKVVFDAKPDILPTSLIIGLVLLACSVVLALAELLSLGVDIERNTASRESND